MTENWELCSVLGLLLVIYILVEYRIQASGKSSLSPQMASLQMNRKNTIVLDIRKEPSYQAGHIIGSLHCTMSQLKKLSQLEGLPPSQKKNLKSHTLIIVDDHGTHSAKALKILKSEGHTSVMTLKGGIGSWIQDKYPLTKAARCHTPVEQDKPAHDHRETKPKKKKSLSTEE